MLNRQEPKSCDPRSVFTLGSACPDLRTFYPRYLDCKHITKFSLRRAICPWAAYRETAGLVMRGQLGTDGGSPCCVLNADDDRLTPGPWASWVGGLTVHESSNTG